VRGMIVDYEEEFHSCSGSWWC